MASYRSSKTFRKSGNYDYLKRQWNDARESGKLYAVPFIGDTIKKFDNYKDFSQMQADYTKNTGRQILYPSVRAYSSAGYSALGHAVGDIIAGAGRTVRRLI